MLFIEEPGQKEGRQPRPADADFGLPTPPRFRPYDQADFNERVEARSVPFFEGGFSGDRRGEVPQMGYGLTLERDSNRLCGGWGKLYGMTWIDKRLEERRALEARRKALTKGLEVLFVELYRKCVEALEHYNKHAEGESVQQTMKTVDYFEFAKPGPDGRPAGLVRVEADFEAAGFRIRYDGGFYRPMPVFTVDLGVLDGPVLKHEGREIEISEAVERILDPLLFSDLRDSAISCRPLEGGGERTE